ncbi:MAG: PAS domain-containing protein [Sphingomonas bacterium]|nr:PAS domain-containing protein [Sphingomonas bacterium]
MNRADGVSITAGESGNGTRTPPAAARQALVVGIGASAGGLDAFRSFFTAMQADSGMAFVLIQHLSPDHKSMLAELLGRNTAMDVIEATDGTEVKPNCVFVIPPNATMRIKGGRLKIIKPAPPRNQRRPIDTFFQSLAEDQGENAVCIILAGTGSDGTLGVATIKEHGGLTLAQAEYDHQALPGMPQSAAASGQVDDILPADAMPARLLAYQKHLAGVAPIKDEDGTRTDASSHLSAIMAELRARTGHDFSGYKEKTLVRRLQRRMQVLQVTTPSDYIEQYREHPDELDRLFQELLIGVTQFFRDPAAFQALDTDVLKGLVAGKGADETVRIWVPGCSTGQEAYTIAMLLREAMDKRRAKPKIQIFGTDIDDRAIACARLGRYLKPVGGVSPERFERWFIEEADHCCVVPEIREMCVFSAHSVIKHPPFSKLDLISCRNLLIYIDPAMQDRVMRTFHYALKPGGRLFLGSSESVTRSSALFGAIDKKHRIFERRAIEGASLPDVPSRGTRPDIPRSSEPTPLARDHIDQGAQRVMEKYHPPHLVIDRRNQIVRFSGGAVGEYLEPSPGVPSFALFDILRKPLRPAVRAALHDVRASNAPVRHENIPIRIGASPRLVTIIVDPMTDDGPPSEYIVLAFQDAGSTPADAASTSSAKAVPDDVKAIERELQTTRAQLQSTIDELEITGEEMKSSNEEYQSVNEELQSSNEELETSKEEMQSINEELQTINAEMTSKNDLLTRLNSDVKNLLDSTEIATLFLDDLLRIKSFTRGVADLFHVRDGDIGRPITDIAGLLTYGDLQRDVKAVLRKLIPIERQVTLKDAGMTFILRIRPYRTIENVIDGVVLTFMDITAREASTLALRESEVRYRSLFESIDEGCCTIEKIDTRPGEPIDFRYLSANPAFVAQTGVANVVGKTIREAFPGEPQEWFDTFDTVVRTGESIRFERDLVTQGRVLELFAFRIDDEAQRRVGVIFADISHRRKAEERQSLVLKELDHRVKNLFAIVGGVVTLSARSATTPQDMVGTIQGRLGALASAHVLIRATKSGSGANQKSTLDALARTILSPYADAEVDGRAERIVFDGPELAIGGDAVTSLALVLHELATNAAKYGALSTPVGQVHIHWKVDDGNLRLTWTERGGPAVRGPPEREGFGSLLARRSVNGQLGGDLALAWNPEGLTVHLSALTERLVV